MGCFGGSDVVTRTRAGTHSGWRMIYEDRRLWLDRLTGKSGQVTTVHKFDSRVITWTCKSHGLRIFVGGPVDVQADESM